LPSVICDEKIPPGTPCRTYFVHNSGPSGNLCEQCWLHIIAMPVEERPWSVVVAGVPGEPMYCFSNPSDFFVPPVLGKVKTQPQLEPKLDIEDWRQRVLSQHG